ncbi:hypothetical protein [Novosphingobium endophyticum]|nr:hypothetical protein [Novosphingobium endophyticum]
MQRPQTFFRLTQAENSISGKPVPFISPSPIEPVDDLLRDIDGGTPF